MYMKPSSGLRGVLTTSIFTSCCVVSSGPPVLFCKSESSWRWDPYASESQSSGRPGFLIFFNQRLLTPSISIAVFNSVDQCNNSGGGSFCLTISRLSSSCRKTCRLLVVRLQFIYARKTEVRCSAYKTKREKTEISGISYNAYQRQRLLSLS